MSRIKTAFAIGATAASFLALAPSAHAESPPPSPTPDSRGSTLAVDDADLQRKIDSHIAKYGGRQLGKNQILWEYKDGRKARMTFPLPKKAGDVSAARVPCERGWYCVWEHALWDRDGGARTEFYNYGTFALEPIGWAYRVSARENNQYGNAQGTLNWYKTEWSRAYSILGYVGEHNDQALSVTLKP
ncbi:hypothetical protein [Actinomadura rudentiformis]|uniref:Uncharacterized protein n=1 Tax=Actinomadura rudentiformis TaxID=359158 RepID=A0A6H9YX71_9ACTN|nr:hypothetical protein [Actinomadura rudentiformis]KAB2348581.1 hypothetical protein F8566_17570 [Actinomadura rudentiformis]